MSRCVIFCAGGFERLITPIDPTDYIIAADGGFAHTQTLNIVPNAILGDFDSLGFIPSGAEVFPVEKDDTDAMLAVRHGLKLGYKDFLIYGALDGPRLDHTLAALQTLQFLTAHNARGVLVGSSQMATVLRNETLSFPAGCEGTFSMFATAGVAKGVTLHGFYYPMTNGTLTPDLPLGVSNHFTGEAASVQVAEGLLTILWPTQAGLPERN